MYNESGLAVYEEQTEVISPYEMELDNLIDEMILSDEFYAATHYPEKQDEIIKGIYYDLVENIPSYIKDRTKYYVPKISDILSGVWERNDDYIMQISMLDYEQGANEKRSYRDSDSDDRDREDVIQDIFEGWNDDFSRSTGHGYDTEDLVISILIRLHLCFEVDESNYFQYNCDLPGDVLLFACDCQNILFPEWHLAAYRATDLGDCEIPLVQMISE